MFIASLAFSPKKNGNYTSKKKGNDWGDNKSLIFVVFFPIIFISSLLFVGNRLLFHILGGLVDAAVGVLIENGRSSS